MAVDVDSVGQHAAMVEKLRLPFPILSDPDRAVADLYGVSDPKDPREIARPSMILVATDGAEVWRFVSRDFADRLPEEEVLEVVRQQGWQPTTQAPPVPGTPEPGPKALELGFLVPYFRGARFAALAMGLRHGHHDESVKQDSKAYVAELDRYFDAVRELLDREP